MNVITKTPIEVPNPDEGALKHPDVHESIFKLFSTKKEDILKFLVQADVIGNISDYDIPKLTLSGKRNVKKLRNRMTKHMEAYPETEDGFIVKFNGDTKNKLFIVIPCDKDEYPDITIKGIKYKIIEKTLKINPIEEISENTHLEIKEELRYPRTDR